MRLLTRLVHLQGTGDELRSELTRIRGEVKRAVIPEDYEALALQIQALGLGPGITDLEPHHPGHLLAELIDGILPIARALRGEGPIVALERLRNEAANLRSDSRNELHMHLERMAETVSFVRHVADVFKLSTLEIMQALARLSGDESMSTRRLLRLKDDIERADDDHALRALRDRLLNAANSLVSEAEAREARLSQVTARVLEAKAQVRTLTAAISDTKVMALTDPLTGFGSGQALSATSQELAKTRTTTGLLLVSVDGLSFPPSDEQREDCELVLRSLARLVRSELQAGSQGFHLGDGHLVVVVPKTSAQELDTLAEGLCTRFAALPQLCADGDSERFATVACGGVLWGGGQTFAAAMDLAKRAHDSAKRGGGNRYQRKR